METNIPVTRTLQDKPTYCFPACLASYLGDLGVKVTQDEIIRQSPKELQMDSDRPGALKAQDLPAVLDKWKLLSTWIRDSALDIHSPTDAVFITLDWKGDTSSRHWVRFVGYDDEKNCVRVMEPTGSTPFPAEIDPEEMAGWRPLIFRISKAVDFNGLPRLAPTPSG